MDLTLNTRTEGEHTVLAVSGEVDVYTAPALRDRIADLLDSGQHQLVIDLGGVEFLDSTGLGVIFSLYRQLTPAGGQVVFASVSRPVQVVVQLTRTYKVFRQFPTVEAALEAAAATAVPTPVPTGGSIPQQPSSGTL